LLLGRSLPELIQWFFQEPLGIKFEMGYEFGLIGCGDFYQRLFGFLMNLMEGLGGSGCEMMSIL